MQCISANGMGKMCFIQNTIKAARYINILDENLITSMPNNTTFDEYIYLQIKLKQKQQRSGSQITILMS